MIRWEYKVVIEFYADEDAPSLPERLRELGEDGWEVISFQNFARITDVRFQIVLKRPIHEHD